MEPIIENLRTSDFLFPSEGKENLMRMEALTDRFRHKNPNFLEISAHVRY